MARRTKREMELMNNDCRYYLLQTKLEPHKAFDLMVKDHLESHESIPYYIKGIKDFIQVSEELALELNRKEQMKKADKARYEEKEVIINYIMNLSTEETKAIYKKYKDNVSDSDKLALHETYYFKAMNDFNRKDVSQQMINVFQMIYREIKQPA